MSRIVLILSKACEADNFELHNFLRLSFTNIQGLCSNFVDCKFFLESNSPDILLCLRQTWMTQLILVIYLERLSSFNPKRFQYSYAWSRSLCEGNAFAWDLSLENSADSYLHFRLALLHSLSYFFSTINHLLHLCAWFLILFHLIQIRIY